MLKDLEDVVAFQVMIGGGLASPTTLDVDNIEVDTPINTFIAAVTETASEILGKRRAVKKSSVTWSHGIAERAKGTTNEED